MLSSIQHNLPNQLSRFVGREQELAEIGRLLSGGRLVTLTGAGGVGKTRLALQVAADLLAARKPSQLRARWGMSSTLPSCSTTSGSPLSTRRTTPGRSHYWKTAWRLRKRQACCGQWRGRAATSATQRSARGDLATAWSRFRESLSLARQVGEKRVIDERLEELAWVACAEAQVMPAVRLLGAGEAMRETIGAPMPPANRPDYERCVSLARSRLGDDTFRVVWEQGRALRVDQAIAEAMAIEGPVDAPPEPTHLTQREREVVVLVARGLSNREIAEKLVVSVRTSEAHVTHVLNKLGLRSRAQLAVWAVEHGLLNISAGT